jgi:predicted DNA-binding protein (UPF0251 family)
MVRLATPTKKLRLATLRKFFDVLVVRHVVVLNPAASVRAERYAVVEGKTPEISAKQARKLELPEPVQVQVDEGELAPSVAYEVAKLDDAAAQVELAEQVVAEKLTRGEVVEAVKARRAGHTGGTSRPRAVRVEYAVDGGKVTVTVDRDGGDVEAMLEQALAQHRAGGREAA